MHKLAERYNSQTKAILERLNEELLPLYKATEGKIIESNTLIICCPIISYNENEEVTMTDNDICAALSNIVKVHHDFTSFYRPVKLEKSENESVVCKSTYFEIDKHLLGNVEEKHTGNEYWEKLSSICNITDVISTFTLANDANDIPNSIEPDFPNMFVLPDMFTNSDSIESELVQACKHDYYRILPGETLARIVAKFPGSEYIQVWFNCFNSAKSESPES